MIVEAGGPARLVDLGDGIGPGDQQPPKRVKPGRPGEAAGRADDRDQPVTHSDAAIQFLREKIG